MSTAIDQDAENKSPGAQPCDVLVVDDDPEQVTEIAEFLIRKKYNVLTAPDGLTAIEMVQQHQPQVIVMDINMPNMPGDRISEILTSLDHRAAVILMSGYPDVFERVSETADGVIAVLKKPVGLKELSDHIAAVVQK